ncbi:RIMS-binding protein 3A-like [Anas acuta]|uniref:RIMS-binding protein 3A-like n=1 Tax=Anas acuta TaxID=28680 RepID=UPI0035C8DE9A
MAPSRPAPRRGPAQLNGSPAQQEERRLELQALRAKLEAERLHNQELRRHFAAEISKMKEAEERERQLLVQQLQCEWERQQALDAQRLQEQQRLQRATETRQMLRWKAAELQAAQEPLQKELDATTHQARELQRQLADELRTPCRSSSAARAKLQAVLKELRWETHGDQPARIRQLQHELELEKKLFIKFIVAGFEDEQEDSQGTKGQEGPLGKAEPKMPTRAQPARDAAQQGAKESCGSEKGSSRPVKDAQVQVPEPSDEDEVLPGMLGWMLEQHGRLQRAMSGLEKQRQALEAKKCLLREVSTEEECRELQMLQEAKEKLVVLTEQLEEKCRALLKTIQQASKTPGPPPSQSSAEAPPPCESAPSPSEEVLLAQLTQLSEEKKRLEEENSRLQRQLDAAMGVQAENADLKKQVEQMAEEQNSALQQVSELQAQLQEAECQLKALKEIADRGPQLEKKQLETQLELQKKEQELESLQRAQEEGRRQHEEASQMLRAQVADLEDRCHHQTQQLELLAEELQRLQSQQSSPATTPLPQPSPTHPATSQSQAAEDSPGPCPPAEEDAAEESQEAETWQQPFDLQALLERGPARIRKFLALYSYDPADSPNEHPELELPLTAGQFVYVIGDMDEDGWYIGERTDGSRGFVPSNLVQEVFDELSLTPEPPELGDVLLDTDEGESSTDSSSSSSGEARDDRDKEICPDMMDNWAVAEAFLEELRDLLKEDKETSREGNDDCSDPFCLSLMMEEEKDQGWGANGTKGQ